MRDRWTAEQSLLLSKWAYQAGQWRAQADAFARYLRSGLQSDEERAVLLAAYDELGCPCPCHKAVQPGLIPCPECKHSSRYGAPEET